MTIPTELQKSTLRPVSMTSWTKRAILLSCLGVVHMIALSLWTDFGTAGGADRSPHHPAASATARRGLFWMDPRVDAALIVAAIVSPVRIRRQTRLLMNGRVTVARVTGDVTPWWYRLQNRRKRMRRLQCEFRLLNGTNRTRTVEVRAANPPRVNAEIVIVYDRDEPRKALAYPARMIQIDRT